MPGSRFIFRDDPDGRASSMVAALNQLPPEPHWAIVGGFAVIIRYSQVHRLTNDLDTISSNQALFLELLTSEASITRLSPTRLRIAGDNLPVDLDVMDAAHGSPLPVELSERAFAIARQHALARSEPLDIVVTNGNQIVAQSHARVATSASLIALKAVALPRRADSRSPQKVGTDIYDLVSLAKSCDFSSVARELATSEEEMASWVAQILTKWFSPDHDQHYTIARLRRISGSLGTSAISEHDLTEVALLADTLQRQAQE